MGAVDGMQPVPNKLHHLVQRDEDGNVMPFVDPQFGTTRGFADVGFDFVYLNM